MTFWKRIPLRLGLQARLTFLTILGLSAMFIAMGFIGLTNQNASMDVVLEQRLALAQTVAAHVDYHTGYMVDELAVAAAEPGFDLTDADLTPEQAALADLYRDGMFTYDVFVTDARGIVLAVEPEALRPTLVGADFSRHPHIRRALDTGQPQVSGVISGVVVSGPLVSLVVPVKNARGEITGLIGGALDPGGPTVSGFIAPMSLGKTGYAQVVDGQGMVIASTVPGAAGALTHHPDLILPLMQRGKPTVSTDSLVTEAGKEFHEVIAFAPIPRLGWAVTIEQDRAEALAPIIQARNQILLASVVTLALAMLFVWLTTRQVTKPVRALAEAARRIASGDLTTSVTVGGTDEVAELGRGFESMRQKLSAWGDELEAAVQQRTRQLSVLYAIDRAAAQSLELDEILNDALDKILEMLEVESGGILLLEADGETMTLSAHRGLSDEFVENIRHIRLGEGISGRAAAERQLVVLDVADYPTERLAPLIVREGFQTLASTPLLSAGELVGALNVSTRRLRAFPPEELELLTAIGQQLGGAVANAQLHADTRRQATQLGLLYDAGLTINRALDPRVQLKFLCEIAMTAVHANRAEFFRCDVAGNQMRFEISAGYSEEIQKVLSGLTFPIGEERGLVGWVAQNRSPLYLSDVSADPRWIPIDSEIRSVLWVPVLHEKELLGTLSVSSARLNAFTPHDERLLISFANQVAVAMENARLYTQSRQNLTRVRNLYELSTEILATTTAEETARVVVQQVVRAAGAHSAMLNLLEPDGQCTLRIGMDTQGLLSPEPPPRPDGTTMEIFRTGEPLIVTEVTERRAPIIPRLVEMGIKAFIGLPLKVGARVIGVLFVRFTESRAFSADETLREALTIFANQAAMALEKARLYQSLRASEQEYRTLIENATELIWALDTEGRFTFVNRQSEEVSGHKLTDWIGKSFAPMIAPPEDLPRIQQIVLETLAGKPQSYEVGIYRADSSIFYLSVNTTPLYRDGQIVGIISFGRDITAQREAETALRQRMTELSTLFEISSALRGVEGVERMFPIIVHQAVAVCQADCGSLSLVDDSAGMLVCRYGTGARQNLVGARLRLGQGISGQVAQSGIPHLSPDFQHDPLIAFDPATSTRLPEIASNVCIPLRVGEQIVGAMHLSSYTPRTFAEAEIRLLTAIADMAASAIRRTGLLEQLEHRVHELSALFDVSKMITATLRIEDVLQFVAGATTEAVHAEGSYVFLWDEREERLALRATQGFLVEDVGRIKYRLGEGLDGWVFLESQTVNVPDLAADPRWKREPEHEAPLASGRANSALIVPLVIGKKALGVLGVINKIGAPAPSTEFTLSKAEGLRAGFSASDESLLTALAGQIAIAVENARLYEDVRDLSVAAIRSLAAAIDARDPYTSGHSDDVARLAVQVARKLGWGGADLEMMEFAALLHDVGKIAVPDAVLRKVEPLTADEWNIIRLHPYYSAQIVKPIQPLQRIVSWVYHHQERWDGTGYPDGLRGEAIPLASRIIAVADAFNAMTTDRPYRKACAVAESLTEIERCAGKQFDPAVAQLFLRMMTEK